MSNQTKRHFIALLFLIAFTTVKGQTNKISANEGIWQDYGNAVSAATYPEFHGRLVNVNWSDIEDSSNSWDWSAFDSDVTQHTADSMPVIILVYTGPNAPDWMYHKSNSNPNPVPKVRANNNAGDSVACSPYYLDSNYNKYFKRMIDSVCRHIQSSATRNLIVAMQGCYGSTGDQVAYKGNVLSQYQITSLQFDSLFKVYSSYYYNEYKNNIPSIRLLSNPNPTDASETYWLLNNCPGGWIKCGTFAKGSQINMELDKQSWLYNILNQPQSGQFVMARSEITGPQLSYGRWTNDPHKEMFGIMCYCIYWGLDWPNETPGIIMDHNYDSAFAFFNKYAGQKIPGLATNAMCALKDALDASDSIRFPSGKYGAVSQTNTARYQKIWSADSSYGAKLEDTAAAILNDQGSLLAKGINDVGWDLLPGNYERYLHQINADSTSAGYWNVDGADTAVMYGRYARGFDIANNKNALYFDVDDNFLRNAPLDSAYPVTIEITYFDSGKGSWKLFYDAVGKNNYNKASIKVTDSSTNTWKKASVTLKDAYFGNRSTNHSDFYIKNVSNPNQNVIFSVVELSRAQQTDTGFITTALAPFDTVGINSIVPPNSFVLHASSLNGNNVKIGPLNNCSFSTSDSGSFTSTLILSNYGSTINQTIYVKINTAKAVTISDSIPITGGGNKKKGLVSVSGTVVNTSPILDSTVVTNVTCYNSKNGKIDLRPTGGMDSATFTYKWTKDSSQWSATTQDISNLQPGNYTVVVNSDYGCSTSKKFTISQPQVLQAFAKQGDSVICRGGLTTVTIWATGGTLPYRGTGTISDTAGRKLYPVSDSLGCVDTAKITISNGKSIPTPNPRVSGLTNIKSNQTAAGIPYTVLNVDTSSIYTWKISGGIITSGNGTPSVLVTWNATKGTISVNGTNSCGGSDTTPLNVAISSNSIIKNSFDMNTSEATSNKLSTDETITLMPNPVRDIATVKFFTATSKAYSMMVSDVNGKLLTAQKNISLPGTNLQKFDVANFSAGMYFITLIEQTGERRTIKMIKQ